MSIIIPSRRERKKQAIRDKICEEARRLISLHGIDGTTIDAICNGSDIAKKTFYNYYSSKNDLLIDLCKLNILSRVDDLIDRALEKHSDLRNRLHFVFAAMKVRATTEGRFENEMLAFMVGNLSANLRYGTDQLSYMNQCFLRLFKANEQEIRPPLTSSFCAEMLAGMINTLTLNRLYNPTYDSDYHFDLLLNYVLASMVETRSDSIMPLQSPPG